MTVIWKYPIVVGRSVLSMPIGAKILKIAEQGNEIMLWAVVDSEAEMEARFFQVYGTGHPLPDNCGEYMDSVMIDVFVWHVFELKE